MTDPSTPTVVTSSAVAIRQMRDGLTRFNESIEHSDSYINLMTGLGMPGTSKAIETFYGAERLLRPTELQNLYQSNAYATRIVDRMVDDATRVEWSITGSDKRFDWRSVKSEIDDLGGLSRIGDAWRWSRLYGGGLVVLAVNDGEPDFSKPLRLDRVQSIRALSTLDSTAVLVQGWMASLGSVAWSEPSGYQVIAPWTGDNGKMAIGSKGVIHPSRVIRFDGCRVPAALMVTNGGWAPSVLQRCMKQLTAYGTVYEYAQEIMHDLSVMMVKLEGFNQMTLGDQGIADARELLRQIRWGIDNLNLLVIDKQSSDYQEIKRSVDGFEKMILAFERDLVGASGMSRLILVGEQASGLGASSSDEVRSWYSSVENEQKFTVTPAINRLLEVIFACRRNRGEQVPTEWSITFAPLWTPEPKARAEIAEIWIRNATALIMAGMLSPDEATDLLVRNGVLDDVPEVSSDLGALPEPNDLEQTEPVIGSGEPAANEGPAVPGEPAAPPVAEQALNGAQVASLVEIFGAVSRGELAVEAAEWVISQAVPSANLAQVKVAVAAAAAKAPPASAPTEPSTPAPAAEQAPTDEDEPEDEEHPVDIAWSQDPLPADAMTPKEIAVTIGVKTGRVTKLVREGRVRQWNVLGKKVISLREVRGVILEDNQATDGRRVDWSDRSLSVVLTLPESLARWVPYKAEDTSAPHVTLLYAKEADPEAVEKLRTFLSLYAATLAPFDCELGPVGYFDNDKRVAYASVRTELGDLHAVLMTAAKRVGIDVSERNEYVPHCTLAYLPPGEEYDGPVPKGSWLVSMLDVCYGPTVTPVPLGLAKAS